MRCEEPGALRAYLDREIDGVAGDRVSRHLTVCEDCRRQLEQLQSDAHLTSTTLRLLPGEADFPEARKDRAWSALRAQLATSSSSAPSARSVGSRPEPHNPPAGEASPQPGTIQLGGILKMVTGAFSPRQRVAFTGALAGVLLVGFLLLPAGQAAAVDFLNLFRVQRFAVVTVDPNQPFNALRHLENLGKVTMPANRQPGNDPNTTVQSAGQRAGIRVLVPTTLPAGIAAKPLVSAIPGSEFSFTVDRAKAEAYLKSINAPKTAVPASLDGAKLVASMPTAVTLMYGDASGQPGLVIAQLKSPTATVEGKASLAEMREFLLGIPDLPADTAAQLRGISDWTSTLPIPLPVNKALWKGVSFNGTPALMITDTSAGMSGIIWQKDGSVYAVAGKLNESQLMETARSMK